MRNYEFGIESGTRSALLDERDQRKGLRKNLQRILCSCQGAGKAERRDVKREEQRSAARSLKIPELGEKTRHRENTISGGNDEGVPPVPIPNTEVKPFSAESTWLETAR